VDFTIADFVADLRAPTPSAAAEMVVREREAVAAEVGRLRQALVRSVSALLETCGHRLKLTSTGYAFRRASDMLAQYDQRLSDAIERALESQRRLLENLNAKATTARNRLFTAKPDRLLSFLADRLKSDERILAERTYRSLAACEMALARMAAKLDSLSPLAVLARGYSIAFHEPSGVVIRDSGQVVEGDRIKVKLHRGSLGCSIEHIEREGN
jgi:exodeoxyribonuclease VII large subunit